MSYEKVGKDLERCSLGNINLPWKGKLVGNRTAVLKIWRIIGSEDGVDLFYLTFKSQEEE